MGEARPACMGKIAVSQRDAKSPVFMRVRAVLARSDLRCTRVQRRWYEESYELCFVGLRERDRFDIFVFVSEKYGVVCTCGKKVNPRSS